MSAGRASLVRENPNLVLTPRAMPDALRCVIGLGANLGDRLATFESVVRELAGLGKVTGVSQLYETDPVGGPVQPDYFNAAVCLETELEPTSLLVHLLEIERNHGRVRQLRWGPRHLDLDILWIEGRAIHELGLTIPHARLLERNFALVPLLEVAPDALDPNTGLAYCEASIAGNREGMRLRGSRLCPPEQVAGRSDPVSLWSLRS